MKKKCQRGSKTGHRQGEKKNQGCGWRKQYGGQKYGRGREAHGETKQHGGAQKHMARESEMEMGKSIQGSKKTREKQRSMSRGRATRRSGWRGEPEAHGEAATLRLEV